MNNYTNKKLTMNVKLLYTMEELNTLSIRNMFYKIDRVSLEKTPLGNMDKVEGKKVFIGYNLDDGKFCISVKSYEEFIKHFINQTENLKNKLLTNKNSQIIENNQNTNKYQDIDDLVVELEKELYTKLNSMLDQLKKHQIQQQANALKLQQEISMLKKEKLDLYQKINEMQKRIQDMEMTIGQDPGAFKN